MDVYEKALKLHEEWQGKLSTELKAKLDNAQDLTYAYTPGVARPCLEINKDKSLAYKYTSKANTIAVISDGTAVLGLGDIGPEAAMPVMEGKCCLFKKFGGINAVPIVLDTKDPKEIISIVKALAPTFGGINLEDISAPRCVEIERTLIDELDIPVFHDDQHGTAIVVSAALINALKLVNKRAEDIKVVVSGAGAAGYSIIKLLTMLGVNNIIAFDSKGAINRKHIDTYNFVKQEIAEITNKEEKDMSMAEAFVGADVFVGVSQKDLVSKEMVKSMNKDAIVFALANPQPEILYADAKEAGAKVAATGRSDMPNQINNVVAFPGIFKGALESRAKKITDEMKLAAARGLASMIPDDKIREDYVIVSAFEKNVADVVAKAVADEVRR
jgi:Malic enzyme